ncbi:hypothetical protein [Paenirhodobacter populi]|uniref:hypothetical protein n=1 Tax=Paenirhodobacter populi TaxID=2306993 RepID=UPI000FE2BD5D|nr:hypothetical protein [Sinirhodobacter populi]RWR05004.1 hypothetical protein D2T32_18205 [Sinirhodobacter populi]
MELRRAVLIKIEILIAAVEGFIWDGPSAPEYESLPENERKAVRLFARAAATNPPTPTKEKSS